MDGAIAEMAAEKLENEKPAVGVVTERVAEDGTIERVKDGVVVEIVE
jgi:hypothetical protein